MDNPAIIRNESICIKCGQYANVCPGGCIGGGGQPKGTLMKGDELHQKRIEGLYTRDKEMPRRNIDAQEGYDQELARVWYQELGHLRNTAENLLAAAEGENYQ